MGANQIDQTRAGFSELRREADLESRGPKELAEWRDRAWESFYRVGIPTLKNENWHYSDLRRFVKEPLHWVKAEPSRVASPTGDGVYKLTFSDGVFERGLSTLSADFEVISWQELMAEGTFAGQSLNELLDELTQISETARIDHGGIVDLQRALLERGVLLRVLQGRKLDRPIQIEYRYTGRSENVALPVINWLVIEAGAEAHFSVEGLNSHGLTWAEWNHFSVEEGAKVEVVRKVPGAQGGINLGLVTVSQELKSEFCGRLACEGGELVRETWLVNQNGSEAKTDVQALFLGTETQHSDMRVVVSHFCESGTSSQKARSLLNGESRSTFSGKVVIARDVQMVAAKQLSQSLLLSSGSQANAKPELEIYADNVKANHGATVGQLDPEEIFYLRSRGLSLAQAELMVAQGFVNDFTASIEDVTSKRLLEQWLSPKVESIVAGRRPL